MRHEVLFAGFGGQGIMFAGQLLAYAAMDQGYHVTWFPSYGPEMRGGTAYCYVVFSDKPIGSPHVKHAEIAVVFNNPSFDKFEPTVAQQGLLLCNTSMVERVSQRAEASEITAFGLPATQLAATLGDPHFTNMILIGAMLTLRPILPVQAIRGALDGHLPAHRRDKLALNYRALELGINAVSPALSGPPAN